MTKLLGTFGFLFFVAGSTAQSKQLSTPKSKDSIKLGMAVLDGAYFIGKVVEVNYSTSSTNNSLLFFSTKSTKDASINSFVSKNLTINASYRIRKGVFNTHIFGAAFTYLKVSDSIHLKYNSNYLGAAKSTINFPDFSYNYIHSNVNNVAYPLTGNTSFMGILKRGLGFSGKLNMLAFEGGYNKFIDLGRNWYFSNGIAASRLSAKGYGEYQLTNQCSNGVECSEQEHQLNRRSMFIIQN